MFSQVSNLSWGGSSFLVSLFEHLQYQYSHMDSSSPYQYMWDRFISLGLYSLPSFSWPNTSLEGLPTSEVAQSCLTLCDLMDCSPQDPPSMEFSRQEYRSGLPFPSPGDLPDPGTQESSIAGRCFTVWATREAPNLVLTVRWVYAPRFCLVHNKELERRTLKPSARHSCRVLPCYRILSITLLVCEISTIVR